MLVARLLDRSEVVHVIEACLGETVSLVPLEAAPEWEGAQRIELHAPDLEQPLVVTAEPAGEPVAGMFPLRLRPIDDDQVRELRAFLRGSLPPPVLSVPDDAPALVVVGEFEGMGMLDAPVRDRPQQPPVDPGGAKEAAPDLVFRAPKSPSGATPIAPVAPAPAETTPRAAPVARDASMDETTAVTIVEPAGPERAKVVSVEPASAAPAMTPAEGSPALGGARELVLDDERLDSGPLELDLTAHGQEPVFAPDPLVGRILGGGKYEIRTHLGRGGTGNVYKARHVALDKLIAIKVLHSAYQADVQFAARFHREALATSKLDHPNVMRVLDFGQEPDGLLYIAMEYLAGQDLQIILDTGGPMPLARCVEVMSQVCAALSAAHDLGIVHRDVKPENVVIVQGRDDDGSVVDVVKVCDFGIAKLQDRADGQDQEKLKKLTAVGTIWGTPHYMSPEQARAQPIDARSDIYSCGVILYEMTTGRVPFTDDSALGVAMKHVSEVPIPPTRVNPTVDPSLETVVLKAMQKDPSKRQQSARELRAELRALLEQMLDEKTVRRDVPGGGFQDAKTEVSPPPLDAERTSVTKVDSARIVEDDRPALVVLDDLIDVDAPEQRRPSSAPPPQPEQTASDPGLSVALDDPSSGFAELFVALTAAVSRTSYYERGHPEFDKSLTAVVRSVGPVLRDRGETSIARRDVQHVVQLTVQTGLGETYELRKLVPVSVFEAHGARMADVFVRRHMIALTLKEGIGQGELADVVELLSGPEVATDQLRATFLSRGLRHVSVLFAADLLGRERRLPWEVDLCISRLARDLRALPMLRGVDLEGMRKLRTQLIGDVVRTLRGPEPVRLLLANADLVGVAVRHVPELASLDLSTLIVAALPHALCTRVAGLLLGDLEKEVASHGSEEGGGGTTVARKLVHLFGARFVRERTVDSDEVLRVLHERAILSFPELPPDLQLWILAEQQAEALAKNPEAILRSLDTIFDEARYAREVATLDRAMRVLARRGEAAALWAVVARLERHARGAEPSDSTREGLAARTLRTLQDPALLAPVADALLTGGMAVRDPARGILVSAGAEGARALCAARERGKAADIGRPRFVATLRELGPEAVPVIATVLSGIDPVRPDAEPTLAEDLLRAMPEVIDEDLGRLVARFLSHRAPSVRRVATLALAALWGPRARQRLATLLDDPDDGVRVAAVAGLRRVGGVDAEVVLRIEKILSGVTPAGDDLCATAAAALFDVVQDAKPGAVEVLVKAMEPRRGGVVSRFVGSGKGQASPLVVETIARVLLAIGGKDGRSAVEGRAAGASGALRSRLRALLGS
ncbi:MAG: protein kinase [Deltaproteobacteria bacterium]|nr:protein kinase [Deltaproteobacteria bacterium]